MAFNLGSGSKSGFTSESASTTKATGTVQPFSFGTSSTSLNRTTVFGTSSSKTTKTMSNLFGTTVTSLSSFSDGGFKLRGTTTATTVAASGFGYGAPISGTTSTMSGLGVALKTTIAPAFRGLGGVSATSSADNQNENGSKWNEVSQALKEQQVPDELCEDVKDFEEFVKRQKEGSDEVAKFSLQPLRKIQEDVTSLSYALGKVSFILHRNSSTVQKLRADFTKDLQHIEMARRTQDVPVSLQQDNFTPVKFFIDMVMEFEANMQVYRKQIEELENHLNLTDRSMSLTPRDIYIALCKMQESFISLAANLHSVHDQVKSLKEKYLTYHRIVHNDTTDIFSKSRQKTAHASEKTSNTVGLSPFNQLSNITTLAMTAMTNQQMQQQQGPKKVFSTTPLAGTGLFGSTNKRTENTSLFGSNPGGITDTSKLGGFSGFGSATKPLSAGFGTSATSSSGLFSNSYNSSAGLTFTGSARSGTGTTFELKHPPVGNKRGKK